MTAVQPDPLAGLFSPEWRAYDAAALRPPMTVLSLFSGIGGLDLGLQRAGMAIAGQVEIDPWCRQVLTRHWPEVPKHGDVRTAAVVPQVAEHIGRLILNAEAVSA